MVLPKIIPWLITVSLSVESSPPEPIPSATLISTTVSSSPAPVTDWNWDAINALDATTSPHNPPPATPPPAFPTHSVPIVGADFSRPGQAADPPFPYDGAPFTVIPGLHDSALHPCNTCHAWTSPNKTPRQLGPPHDNFLLQHGPSGKARFWCFTCHHLDGTGGLHTLENIPLSFDESYILCSQCHFSQARDWQQGAHGKRVRNWDGPRQVLTCIACHYSHQPAIPPRAPSPAPPKKKN